MNLITNAPANFLSRAQMRGIFALLLVLISAIDMQGVNQKNTIQSPVAIIKKAHHTNVVSTVWAYLMTQKTRYSQLMKQQWKSQDTDTQLKLVLLLLLAFFLLIIGFFFSFALIFLAEGFTFAASIFLSIFASLLPFSIWLGSWSINELINQDA